MNCDGVLVPKKKKEFKIEYDEFGRGIKYEVIEEFFTYRKKNGCELKECILADKNGKRYIGGKAWIKAREPYLLIFHNNIEENFVIELCV